MQTFLTISLPLKVQIEITQDSVPHICVVLFALLKSTTRSLTGICSSVLPMHNNFFTVYFLVLCFTLRFWKVLGPLFILFFVHRTQQLSSWKFSVPLLNNKNSCLVMGCYGIYICWRATIFCTTIRAKCGLLRILVSICIN